MMSANSSLNKKYRSVVWKQRMWVAAVTLLTFLLTNVVLPTLALASIRYDWAHGSKVRTLSEAMQNMAGRLMPHYGQVIWVFGAMLAVLLASQGFVWMDSRRQMDFYESQPVSRTRHFWSVVGSSFEIFVGCYLGTMVIAAFICLVMGAYSNALLVEGVKITLRLIVEFAGFFAITVLAMVLTGNIVVACMASAVFFFYEAAVRVMIEILDRSFYKTYLENDMFTGRLWTSPVAWYFEKSGWISLLGGLALAVIVISIAFLVYRSRKSEDAGEAVLHKPVRIAAKIAVSFLAGLIGVAGCIGSNLALIPSLIMGIAAACVVACVMEAIYNADVRRAFKNFGWTIMGGILAAIVFCVIYLDLTGYDRWVPDKDSVKSAYINSTSYMGNYFDTDGSYLSDKEFVEKYMYLTDIDAVNALLKAGEDYMRDRGRDMPNTSYEYEGETEESFLGQQSDTDSYWDDDRVLWLQIYYRMKSGKVVGRQLQIPRNTSAALLDPIFGSEEYKNGACQIYHDEFIVNNLENLTLSAYSSEDSSAPAVPAAQYYEKLREAYMKDLAGFDWTYDLTHSVAAEIILDTKSHDIDKVGSFYSEYLQVYAGFENTLKAMEEAGIGVKPAEKGDMPGVFGYY